MFLKIEWENDSSFPKANKCSKKKFIKYPLKDEKSQKISKEMTNTLWEYAPSHSNILKLVKNLTEKGVYSKMSLSEKSITVIESRLISWGEMLRCRLCETISGTYEVYSDSIFGNTRRIKSIGSKNIDSWKQRQRTCDVCCKLAYLPDTFS